MHIFIDYFKEKKVYVSPVGDEPLITTKEQCELAVKEILDGKNKVLAVDCEGINLGRNGRLCLVQVATPTKAYLFGMSMKYYIPFCFICDHY